MARVTYFDHICGCYKLKSDIHANIIQRMGKIEDAIENYINVAEAPFADNTVDMIYDRIDDIVNAYKNA